MDQQTPPLLGPEGVAELLIRLSCVQLSPDRPFTYSSGLSGPIYCDNRRVWSFPRERQQLVSEMAAVLKKRDWDFDTLAGVATAGIPMAAFLAAELSAPLLYIRPRAKEHGKKNQVEGSFQAGESAVLLEDLVNQGQSLERAVLAAREAGLNIVGCLCLVDYQMLGAHKRLEKLGLELAALTNFSTLSEVARKQGLISPEGQDLLERWRREQA